MKQVYSSIKPATGVQVSGICKVQVAPREWLATDPLIDFSTGKILTPLSFISGKTPLTLEFTQESYDYQEKPKSSRGGMFYDVSCVGTTNEIDAVTQQVLESFKNHELIVLVKDRKKRTKLVGNKEAGCILQVSYRQGNSGGGTEIATIDISMECEDRPPFYL